MISRYTLTNMRKKILLSLLALIGFNLTEAQRLKTWKKSTDNIKFHLDSITGLGEIDASIRPSDEKIQYTIYRLQISAPPYGLTKVRELCYSLKAMEDSPIDTTKITEEQKSYRQLSLREKFTYNMIHPEWYRQICSSMPIILYEDKKIFAQLPNPFAEHGWSEQQSKFFIYHRDSVVVFLRDCVAKGLRVGVNFKHVIVNVNAKELIPIVISTYKLQKKDHDILTVLMLLMRNSGYKPFVASSLYKSLYADEHASYKSSVDWTFENEALIIKLSNNFYNGLGK